MNIFKMARFVTLKQLLNAAAMSVTLGWSNLSAQAADATNTVTLTYEELGFANGSPIPTPYPNPTLTAAMAVNHFGIDGAGNEMVVPGIDGEDVTFTNGGFGDLINAAVGPTVTPSDFSLPNPAFGKITITPTDSSSYLRLISFKVATKDDGAGDETGVQFYINTLVGNVATFVKNTSEATVAGDVNNTTHTLHTYGGTPITAAPGQGIEVLWQARNGRLALDDFKFEVVTPSSARMMVTLPGETFTSGSGNGGAVGTRTAGVPFNLTLTAVTNNNLNQPVIDISYSGSKTMSYSGPGGSPVYTTSVLFNNGQATGVATTLKLAETTSITAAETGVLLGAASSSLTVNPAAFTKLQVLVPGESAAPGTASGKTGPVAKQSVGTAFNVTINAVDDYFNLLTSAPADNIHVTTSDAADIEPGDNSLSSGTRAFSITPATVGTLTVTAADSSPGGIAPDTSSAITVSEPLPTRPFTLDYEGLGVANNASIPNPYPGIAAATVEHFGRDQAGALFEDVYYWDGVSPGSGYGDLINVAEGPSGTPISSPAWGGIRITPKYPNNFIRLKSFDIAALDDNNADETVAIAVYDPVGGGTDFYQPSVSVAGDFDNTTHTHYDFGGNPVEIPANRSLAFIWTANSGRVAVDNVEFEIVGPDPEIAAADDFYIVAQGGTLTVTPPGVLKNDLAGSGPGPMTAALVTGAAAGTLSLSNNGGFTYSSTGSPGMDGFLYQANDGLNQSTAAAAMISVLPQGALFYDDFARPGGLSIISPWRKPNGGTWNVVNGVLQGTSPLNSAGHVYFSNNWSDYSVEVRASLPVNGYGWSVGGRLNMVAGKYRYYGIFIGPYGDPSGTWSMDLIKYTDWDQWPGPGAGMFHRVNIGTRDTAIHAVKMKFLGNRIMVDWDGIQQLDVTDNDIGGPAYPSGGIAVGLYTGTENYAFSVEDVTVQQLRPIATDMLVKTTEDTATNLVLLGSIGPGTMSFAIPTGGGPTNGTLSGLNPVTGTVTYRPNTNYFGPDAFRFTVSDGTLFATGLVSITVAPANLPPVVGNPIPPQAATYGAQFNFQFGANTFTDPLGDPLTYTASGMPPGITFNGPTRTFSGIPTRAVTNSVVVAAADPLGLRATNTFTIGVARRALTVTAVTDSKEYDATVNSTGLPTITTGTLAGSDTATWTQSFNNKNAGADKILVPAGTVSDGNGGNNYLVTFVPNATGVIMPARLTVNGITASNKVYDGSAVAVLNTASAAIARLSPLPPASVDIGFRYLASSSTTTGNRTYATATYQVGSNCLALAAIVSTDSSPVSAPTNFSGNGLTWQRLLTTNFSTLAAPTINLSVYAAMSNKVSAVGPGTVAFLNDRTGCSIYVCEFTNVWFANGALGAIVQSNAMSGTTANPSNVLSALEADGRNAAVAFFGVNANGLKATAEAGWTEDADSGYNNPSTGIGAYHRLQTTDSSLVVTRGAVNWGSAMLELRSIPPWIPLGGDVTLVTSGAIGMFEDRNRGTNKLVMLSGLALTGADAANFTLTGLTASADITPKSLTVTALTITKSYDGTTSSAGEPTIAPALAAGDTENFNQSYDTKNVGTGKTLTPSGSVNDGNSGNNYTVRFANNKTGGITPLAITVTAVTATKSYDGTTSSAGEPTIAPALAAGDTENFGQSYATKNVGTGKTLTPSGSVNDGNTGANYAVAFANNLTGEIILKGLTAIADSQSRTYGQPNPIFTLTYSGFVSGEDASVLDVQPTAETGATINSPAGNYTISVIGGSDDNYELLRVSGTLTVVGAPPVILSLTGAGTTNVVLTWSAISNRTYRLLYANDLQTGIWINEPSDVTALGPIASTTNATDISTQRFYRVLLLP